MILVLYGIDREKNSAPFNIKIVIFCLLFYIHNLRNTKGEFGPNFD